MYCPKCGVVNRDEAKFCSSCGSALPQRQAQQRSQQSPPPPSAPPQPASAPKKRDTGTLIAALLAFGVAIWNILDMRGGDSYMVILDVIPVQYLAIPLGIILLVLYFKDK